MQRNFQEQIKNNVNDNNDDNISDVNASNDYNFKKKVSNTWWILPIQEKISSFGIGLSIFLHFQHSTSFKLYTWWLRNKPKWSFGVLLGIS